MFPAAESIDDVREAGSRLSQVRRIDLRDIAKANELRAWASPCQQRLPLLRREVLRFIQNQESIEERASSHEIQRTNLDPVSQQIIRCRATPVAAFLALREHFQVIHERAHPRLHLFFLGTRQKSDVLAERDG